MKIESGYTVCLESARQGCWTELCQKNMAMIWLIGSNMILLEQWNNHFAVIFAVVNPENRLAVKVAKSDTTVE